MTLYFSNSGRIVYPMDRVSCITINVAYNRLGTYYKSKHFK